MEYYILQCDDAEREDRSILAKAYRKKDANSFVEFHKLNRFPDFWWMEKWIVSEKAKKLLELCSPGLLFQGHVFFDISGTDYRLYFEIENFPVYSVISDQTEYYPNKLIKKLILNPFIPDSETIFQVKTMTEGFTIINTDLTESLLRRNLYGYDLIRVEIEGEVGIC